MSKYTPLLVVIVVILVLFLLYQNFESVITSVTGLWSAWNWSWSNVSVGAAAPVVEDVLLEDAPNDGGSNVIVLYGGSNKTVWCNATVVDDNGGANFNTSWANASIFDTDYTNYQSCNQESEWDNNMCYFVPNETYNANCTWGARKNDTAHYLNCTFEMRYNANYTNETSNLNWICTINVTDADNYNGSGTNTSNVSQLLAVAVDSVLEFGNMNVGDYGCQGCTGCDQNPDTVCEDLNHTVWNYGNIQMDLALNGTDMSGSNCGGAGYIDVQELHYNCTSYTNSWSKMSPLTETSTSVNCTGFDLYKSTTPQGPPADSTKKLPWKLHVPSVSGYCEGNITFNAIDGR
ncbi:MAG: hypothetical protein ACE5J4_00860 [Candidatus Aenigmatarchaeota archaeon]